MKNFSKVKCIGRRIRQVAPRCQINIEFGWCLSSFTREARGGDPKGGKQTFLAGEGQEGELECGKGIQNGIVHKKKIVLRAWRPESKFGGESGGERGKEDSLRTRGMDDSNTSRKGSNAERKVAGVKSSLENQNKPSSKAPPIPGGKEVIYQGSQSKKKNVGRRAKQGNIL